MIELDVIIKKEDVKEGVKAVAAEVAAELDRKAVEGAFDRYSMVDEEDGMLERWIKSWGNAMRHMCFGRYEAQYNETEADASGTEAELQYVVLMPDNWGGDAEEVTKAVKETIVMAVIVEWLSVVEAGMEETAKVGVMYAGKMAAASNKAAAQMEERRQPRRERRVREYMGGYELKKRIDEARDREQRVWIE